MRLIWQSKIVSGSSFDIPMSRPSQSTKRDFRGVLCSEEAVAEGLVIGQGLEFLQFGQVGNPVISDRFGDERRKRRIGGQAANVAA